VGEDGQINFIDGDYQPEPGLAGSGRFDMRPPLLWLAGWLGPYFLGGGMYLLVGYLCIFDTNYNVSTFRPPNLGNL
jgi:hypothetical protein